MNDSRHVERAVDKYGVLGTFNAHTPYEVFDRQHQVLREGLRGLRSALVSDHPSDCARLVEHVDTVRAQLAVHFAFEEDDGFMHYLRIAQPAVAPEIAQLQKEHKEILAVLKSAAAGLHSGLSCADVRATLSSVVEHLADHELDERNLLRSTLRRG